jgi:hypothetical protein
LVSLLNHPPELLWAERKVTAECMAKQGFRYPPYELGRRTDPEDSNLAGVALLTVPEAQQRGYGLHISSSPDPQALDPDAATAQYLATLTPAEQQRYHTVLDPGRAQAEVELSGGVRASASIEGCVAEGRAHVYGSVENFLKLFYLPQGIRQFSEQALRAPAVTEARRAYARCMRSAGYRVESPADALDLARTNFGTTRTAEGTVSDAERGMAVADATCQAEADLHRVIDDALVQAGSAWLNEHEGEILGLADLQREALDRARLVLESA